MIMKMRAIALALAASLTAAGCAVHPAAVGVPEHVGAPAAERELVVLVHGMGRSPLSMLRMERSLESAGYEVLNWGYSSTCCTVDELGDQLRAELATHLRGRPARVHFVGHSLGTVVIRSALSEPGALGRLGRVVLLAPPSSGARSADRTASWLGWLLRPLHELVTTDSSAANTLPWPADSDIAVIAGRFDGKVSIEEARIPDAYLVVLPATHTFLMMRPDAIRYTLEFLRTGHIAAPTDP